MARLLLVVVVAAVPGAVAGGVVARLVDEQANVAEPPATVRGTPPQGRFPSIPDIIAGLRESIVSINVVVTVQIGPRAVPTQAAGTGFVLTSDGLIGTNAHVLSGAQSITVGMPDGSREAASLVGIDNTQDLAVIKVSRSGLTPATFGDSRSLRVGDLVIAIGNALALEGGPTATMGIVSALNRTVTASDGSSLSNLIQADAAINEGDSGGLLTDANGLVVGINTIGSTSAENIAFAIAIETAAPVFERLKTGH